MTASVKSIISDFNQSKSERSNFDSQYQDVSDYVLTTREFQSKSKSGNRRTTLIFDATAPDASMRLASALTGLEVNPSLMWFGLRHQDISINRIPEVRAWLEDTRDRIMSIFNNPDTGFYLNIWVFLLFLL